MIPIITSEHLTLTPALKQDVDRHLEKLTPILTQDSTLRAFLTVDRENHFQVLFKTHLDHHDLIARKSSYDLHTALTRAYKSFRRLIIETKK